MNGMQTPTDHELVSLVHSMWNGGLNLEAHNIIACMESKLRVDGDAVWRLQVHAQLKRLVRERKLRRVRFLPGRPKYTIA